MTNEIANASSSYSIASLVLAASLAAAGCSEDNPDPTTEARFGVVVMAEFGSDDISANRTLHDGVTADTPWSIRPREPARC